MRHPKIMLACLAYARAERKHGAFDYVRNRANDAASPFDVTVDRGKGVSVRLHRVPVAGGDVEVAVYRGAGASAGDPAHVMMHGGGFCYGDYRNADVAAREYAAAGVTVVSVAYRLAPEHPWPTPAEDCYSALRWTADNGDLLGIDPARLSVGGLSAGGCLAAVVALLARDRGGPALVCQVLEIPITDLTMNAGDSMRRYGRRHLLTRDHLAESYAYYVPHPADRRRPTASPLLAPDLRGLPPAVLIVAEQDPLRDEGVQYAQRLRAAGVPAELVLARGHVHSSTYTPLPSARRYRAAVTAMLTRAHGLPTTR